MIKEGDDLLVKGD